MAAPPITYPAAEQLGVSFVMRRIARRVALDVSAWVVALPVAMAIRLDMSTANIEWRSVLPAALLAGGLHAIMEVLGAFGWGRRVTASFAEALATVVTAATATVVLFVVNLVIWDRWLPASLALIAGFIAVSIQMGARLGYRLLHDARRRPSRAGATAVFIFGAGEAGHQIASAMLRDPSSPFFPIGVFDDDPRKADLRVVGVPVLGSRREITRYAEAYAVEVLVIALPSAGAAVIRELSAIAAGASLVVRVVPPLRDLVDGTVAVGDLRPTTAVDLLGRHEIHTDLVAIANYITDKRVLITGAGGSIGSELCRQIDGMRPASLVMLDRDESALHAVQLTLKGRATLDDPALVVADIRDGARLREVFDRHQPEVVFHAAALKHLTLLEMHPDEAIKTNVFGTQNVLDAARAVGVRTLVNVSTDKAADPCSVLGYTKRIAERLTANAQPSQGAYLSVRFGNVLGSRGSVLTVFHHQIATGGPVTVTDPAVKRYFMTIEEAVELVVQAGAIGRSAEVLVLDMGEPVAIAEVAQRLIEASGETIPIEFTGLRRGEKLVERMLAEGERDERPFHPQISHVSVAPLSIADVVGVLGSTESAGAGLVDLCGPAKTRPLV